MQRSYHRIGADATPRSWKLPPAGSTTRVSVGALNVLVPEKDTVGFESWILPSSSPWLVARCELIVCSSPGGAECFCRRPSRRTAGAGFSSTASCIRGRRDTAATKRRRCCNRRPSLDNQNCHGIHGGNDSEALLRSNTLCFGLSTCNCVAGDMYAV